MKSALRFAPSLLCALTALTLAAPASAQLTLKGQAPPVLSPTAQLQVYSTDWAAKPSLVAAGHCPTGDANMRRQIVQWNFPKPFLEAPKVTIALNGFDSGDGRNIRIATRVDNPTPRSVTLIFETWCDTNIYQAAGSAIAVGRQAPK